ncbi:Mitochondrial protein C2orf69 homolog [Linum grandiflorum]
MERWKGVLKVPLKPETPLYRVAVSLCLSTKSANPSRESSNAILFHGDRVAGTGSPVIEKLSDPQTIADILVSKFGDSVNAWVIEASVYNGPFAIYRDFIPTVNRWGEPKCYDPSGFPASTSIVSLLSTCYNEVRKAISVTKSQPSEPMAFPSSNTPATYILGFSKGGTVINQLVTELSCLGSKSISQEPVHQIIPGSKEDLLNSISQVHYVDVGLNSAGAYITNREVIETVGKRLNAGIRFVLHGTPRQWGDDKRVWIREEKDELMRLLECEAGRTGGKLQVCQKVYFSERVPDMEMHFEIIEAMDVMR